MTAQPLQSLKTTATLNETPLSQHVMTLMKKAHVTPQPGLLLTSLLFWATDNLEVDPLWAEDATGQAALAEQQDPEALYANLKDAETPILEAETLVEAARALLRLMGDLIPA